MVVILAAAMRKQKNDRCRDFSITIKNSKDNLFINEKDVQQLLIAKNGTIKGKLLSSFNLNELERMLKTNKWIKDAELYFDNNEVLHTVIYERQPLARIFTTEGNTFYIDKDCNRMPLSERISASVPVFTGYPDNKKMNGQDSLLLFEIRNMAKFINADSFWMAQTAQVNINEERNFEMIPVVGNHLVKLGNGDNLDQKFNRLFTFYKEVLSKTGFDKYRVIDVQYAGQVVASKQAGNVKVDMAQLRKNVDKLLKDAIDTQKEIIEENDPAEKNEKPIQALTEKPLIKSDSSTAHKPDLKLSDGPVRNKPYDPNAVKTTSVSKPDPENKKMEEPKTENDIKVPKAVMPKKEEEQ